MGGMAVTAFSTPSQTMFLPFFPPPMGKPTSVPNTETVTDPLGRSPVWSARHKSRRDSTQRQIVRPEKLRTGGDRNFLVKGSTKSGSLGGKQESKARHRAPEVAESANLCLQKNAFSCPASHSPHIASRGHIVKAPPLCPKAPVSAPAPRFAAWIARRVPLSLSNRMAQAGQGEHPHTMAALAAQPSKAKLGKKVHHGVGERHGMRRMRPSHNPRHQSTWHSPAPFLVPKRPPASAHKSRSQDRRAGTTGK